MIGYTYKPLWKKSLDPCPIEASDKILLKISLSKMITGVCRLVLIDI
jgi:hypothetical protein